MLVCGLSITYFDGWDGSLFAENCGGDFPVILLREFYDEHGETIALSWKGLHIYEAVGIYDGTVDGGGSFVLVPLSAYRHLSGDRVSYSKAHLWLDPALNRTPEPFLSAAEAAEAVQSAEEEIDWKTENGSHTFSLAVQSSYTEIQNIRSNKLYILKWHDKCSLNVDYFPQTRGSLLLIRQAASDFC